MDIMFNTAVLASDPVRRQQILSILEAALQAVNPFKAVQSALHVEKDTLWIGEHEYMLSNYENIYVVGAGKASTPMTQAIEALVGDRISGGLVVTKSEHGGPTKRVQLAEASHPVPDELGVDGGRQVLRIAEAAGQDDLVITLLSGGGSSLLVAPAVGLTLDDLQLMTNALLRCGATINEINILRKHCSAVKGGQLARAVAPADLVTLVLSDVIGNPLDVIASGPTVPDSTTWRDAWTIIERYDLLEQIPMAILGRIQAGLQGAVPDTPEPGDPLFERSVVEVIGDNRIAARAAADQAQLLGFDTLLLTTYLEGEAQEVAKVAVSLAKEILSTHQPLQPPACLILGGETTVRLGDDPGRGGRNQELALAAAIALEGIENVTIVSLATDGTDGPTDSAGAMADGTTVARGRAEGLSARAHLQNHDAYPYLDAVHDLLLTGPTQTNVNDLIFVFVY
ncbi:MAG: glycerate kinase [Chloroflexota bacterium]